MGPRLGREQADWAVLKGSQGEMDATPQPLVYLLAQVGEGRANRVLGLERLGGLSAAGVLAGKRDDGAEVRVRPHTLHGTPGGRRRGAVTSACLADLDYHVLGVDRDASRLEAVNGGYALLHELGLEELLAKNLASGSWPTPPTLGRPCWESATFS